MEQVHSMPKQGIVSAWNFALGVGTIIGICNALDLPLIEISPMKWKKLILGENYDHIEKTGAICYCQDKFPKISLLKTKRSRVAHDGFADSICIGLSYFFIKTEI
jgi:hypothetical protein